MSFDFKIVTFYTPEYAYLRDVWIASVAAQGHDYVCVEREGKGSWKKNVLEKSVFMLEMILKYPEYNILWVDIDGVVQGELPLMNELAIKEYDMASRTYSLTHAKRRRPSIKKFHGQNFYRDRMACSATVWLNNNDKIVELLGYACDKTYSFPGCWHSHEDLLNHALNAKGRELDIKYYDMPVEYCYIEALEWKKVEDEYNVPISDAVIVQGIASREHKERN